MQVSLANTQLLPRETDLIEDEMDCHFQMGSTLVQVRRIVKEAQMEETVRADLLQQLDHIYKHLRMPLDGLIQDIGGRNN